MGQSRSIVFTGPAGRLEGILQGREGTSPEGLAVVCHPLPTGGGTMHTKVVHRVAKALEECGWIVLRFNFRGVGRSEGTFDRGTGELEDARAALDHLAAAHPGRPITMAGFSFGSWVGLRLGATDPRVDSLIALAPPVNLYDFSFLETCAKPKLVVHGEADELVPLRALEEFYPSIAEPKSLVLIEGASHLLTEGLEEVARAVKAFASRARGGA